MNLQVSLIISFLHLVPKTDQLLCYNGTFTFKGHGEDPLHINGIFAPSNREIAKIRCFLTIMCPKNSMCFVRSWSARAQHKWMVQRGCYLPATDDPLPRTVNTPTRAMTCKHERFPDAEYKVCLCKADWCNSATNRFPYFLHNIIIFSSFVTMYVIKLQKCF